MTDENAPLVLDPPKPVDHTPQRFIQRDKQSFTDYAEARFYFDRLPVKKGAERKRIRLRADKTFDVLTFERKPEGKAARAKAKAVEAPTDVPA